MLHRVRGPLLTCYSQTLCSPRSGLLPCLQALPALGLIPARVQSNASVLKWPGPWAIDYRLGQKESTKEHLREGSEIQSFHDHFRD